MNRNRKLSERTYGPKLTQPHNKKRWATRKNRFGGLKREFIKGGNK